MVEHDGGGDVDGGGCDVVLLLRPRFLSSRSLTGLPAPDALGVTHTLTTQTRTQAHKASTRKYNVEHTHTQEMPLGELNCTRQSSGDECVLIGAAHFMSYDRMSHVRLGACLF